MRCRDPRRRFDTLPIQFRENKRACVIRCMSVAISADNRTNSKQGLRINGEDILGEKYCRKAYLGSS